MRRRTLIVILALLFAIAMCPIAFSIWYVHTLETVPVITRQPTTEEVIHKRSNEFIRAWTEQLQSKDITEEQRHHLQESIEHHKRVMKQCEDIEPSLKDRR
jgi:hypothetical protein